MLHQPWHLVRLSLQWVRVPLRRLCWKLLRPLFLPPPLLLLGM